ncbi:MAG: gamma-glutamylcyclotransferase [Rhodospirillales bacterium]|nr:gamma-glutamylcyclotransferase [Rhodospirillales bacterium]
MTHRDGSADTRFAAYGTLAPGRVNHDRLAGLKGRWLQGTVRGRLVDAGWGSELGYPGLVLDPLGSEVAVSLLESPELPDLWSGLDEFEGAGYRRVVAQVRTAEGELDAWVYVLAAWPEQACPVRHR